MSSYHASFTYLNKNSADEGFIVASFDPDNGQMDSFLGMEQVFTESYDGTKRNLYGLKYNTVATINITLVKYDKSDFSVYDNRRVLKWLTGSRQASWLDLYEGENLAYSFWGSVTSVQQQKLDARIVGIIITFESTTPWAYSSLQSFSCRIGENTLEMNEDGVLYRGYEDNSLLGIDENGIVYNDDDDVSATFKIDNYGVIYNEGDVELQIDNQSDDLYTYINPNMTYTNFSGNATGNTLSINNTTLGQETYITGINANEVVTISSGQFILSNNPLKIFGDTFNFVWPKLQPGLNSFIINGSGKASIEFTFRYPIKIGDCALDIDNNYLCVSAPPPVPVGDVRNVSVVATTSNSVSIKWSDPPQTVVDCGATIATWASTKVVYKTDGYPTSVDDGVLVTNSTIHNAYAYSPLKISGLEAETTYYFGLFTISTEGVVNNNNANAVIATPMLIRISKTPNYSNTLIYTGNEQAPSWNNYNDIELTIGGTIRAIDAGYYDTTFTPNDGYCWDDGSTETKTISWSIAKADGYLSVSQTDIVLDADNISRTINVTRYGDGAITAISSDISIATVTLDDNVITINSVNNTYGIATITVSVDESTNYTAPYSVPIYISVLPLKDTLDNMSWNDISIISKSGHAANYWSTEDYKSVDLDGTTYYVQIIGFDHDEVVDESSYGRNKAGITFKLGVSNASVKHTGVIIPAAMNNSATNQGGWHESNMRTGYMAQCKNKLPEDCQSVLVPVIKWTSNGYQSNLIQGSHDETFLLSEKEVFGNSSVSSTGMFDYQYDYYANGNDVACYDENGSQVDWWLRSPSDSDAISFACVHGVVCELQNSNSSSWISFAFCV